MTPPPESHPLAQLRHDAALIARAGIAAVDPAPLVASALTHDPLESIARSRVKVVSIGKASAGMMRGFLAAHPNVSQAVVVAPLGAERPSFPHDVRVDWMESAHPDPDERSLAAANRVLATATSLTAGERLVVLLSGGASAMMAAPADGVTLEDKRRTARALMHAGVSIADLNCVRKHLSRVKGGWLGEAARWQVTTLALSDVHGPVEDDPSTIGSGPAVPDPTTFAEARAIARRAGRDLPGAVRQRLERGVRGEYPETPKRAGEPARAPDCHVIGSRRTAMAAARTAAIRAGYDCDVLDPPTAGEARLAGHHLVSRWPRERLPPRWCLIASGETIVTVKGSGTGGRNQEFVLGAVPMIESIASAGKRAVLVSVGTDGIDGPTDAAGAVVDTTTLTRARALGIALDDVLARNDAYRALDALDDLLRWGPTGTNVGDIHILVVAG